MSGPPRASERQVSPLELLLAAGFAGRALVIGSGCPPRLLPGSADGAGEPDLVVIAPDEAESRRPGWPGHAVAACAGRLAAGGAVYVLAPPAVRRAVGGELRRQGLVPGASYLHLPDAATSRHLVALDRRVAAAAFRGPVPLARWKRTLAPALLALGGAAIATRRAGRIGTLFCAPAERPGLGWLDLPVSGPPGRVRLLVTVAERPGAPSLVLQPFSGAAPTGVVVKLRPGASSQREGERLRQLAPLARRAGARVPEPLGEPSWPPGQALLETALEGEPLAALLARRPARLRPGLERVAAWLTAWQRLAGQPGRLDRAVLDAEVLAPARELGDELDPGYRERLGLACRALEGRTATLAPAHNDLTSWNVLVAPRQTIAIVDWEAAEPRALPACDFPYAAADAALATGRYPDRLRAAQACFSERGAERSWVERLERQVAAATGSGGEVLALAWHSCWLKHAANERRKARAGEPRPFLATLRWAAGGERSGVPAAGIFRASGP